jgi:hypothetical protein
MSRPCELGPSTGVRATLETLVTAAALLATGFLLMVLAFCV